MAPGANYLVKFPSAKRRPVVEGQVQGTASSLPVTALGTDYYIYQDFEGDVWSYWTRGDNTGGRYQWAVKGCNSHWGSYSADPVRGGSQGALLGCASSYPPSIETWMYSSICETIPSDWSVWGHLYLTGTMGSGTDDYFAIYVADSADYLYGYSLYGTWSGWFKLVFNLRQWYYLGDLGKNTCNTVYLDFSSSSDAPAGAGPRIDDFQIDLGPTASTYGQSQIIADPVIGKAPLTVSFRGVTDLTLGSFSWNFRDGTTATSKDAVHTFVTPGTYEVSFRALFGATFSAANATITVQPGPTCSFSLSQTTQSFSTAGGTGSVAVTTPAGCTWTAASQLGWVSITSGSSGSGNGTVSYSVQANPGVARSGSLTIAGQTFTVTQAAQACSYSLTPQSASLPASGGAGSFTVASAAGCQWSAAWQASWITVTAGANGNGNGTVSYSVQANSGSARTGTITVAGQTFTVTQAALTCSYALGASNASFTSLGGGGNVSVTASGGCPWTASTGFNWLHVTNGSGTGSGTVLYSVDANPGSARTGTITIQGQTLTVNQDGASAAATSYWLPAVIHKDVPSRNSWWRSDIAVLNRSSLSANLTLKMYAPSGLKTMTISVAGKAQLLLRDVAGQLGVSAESGTLQVVSDQAVLLTGRTYNQIDATHTYGQDYDGQESSLMLGAGQSAWLPQLTQNALFRTNIGLTNTGGSTASVTLTLFDGQGNQVSILPLNLAPAEFYQFDQPYSNTAARGTDNGYAIVTVSTGSGIVAYASVIDQATGDPTTFNMKR